MHICIEIKKQGKYSTPPLYCLFRHFSLYILYSTIYKTYCL